MLMFRNGLSNRDEDDAHRFNELSQLITVESEKLGFFQSHLHEQVCLQ